MHTQKDEELSRTYSPIKDANFQQSMSLNFNELEVLEILLKVKLNGTIDQLKQLINSMATAGQIRSADMIACLQREGGIGEIDARRVVQFLEVR